MKKSALLFPGQGAQKVGMAQDFFNHFDAVRQLFDTASEHSGFNCEQLLFSSSDDELKETEKTQVAVTLANLASFEALKALGLKASMMSAVAGFSLGEYSALVASGVITTEDCFKLVRERGKLMAKAGNQIITQKGPVAMAAVMGLAPPQVEAVIASLGRDDLFCANYNSPVQLIISGLEVAIDAATEPLKAKGAKRVMKLKVSGPFHTPLLCDAAFAFQDFIKPFTFSNPSTALYSNVTGARIKTGEEAKALLIKQIAAPVQWMDIEQEIKNSITPDTMVIECGPGNVLSGLWKAMFNENMMSAATLEGTQAIFN